MNRGEVWWASLREPHGSEPGYRRPVLIVQSDDYNKSRLRTVITVAITSNVRLAMAPGNVFLRKKDAGLPRDSVANVSQLVTLDRSILTKRVGRLSPQLLRQVEEGLRLVIGL